MAASSRTAQFTRLHKILKKHYRLAPRVPERSVLEHLLFACCLEDAPVSAAEEAFAALAEAFFDWNEVRVSSVRELAEAMARLPDPPAAAHRVKRVLQHVFEDNYAFDLEDLHKKNLGPAVDSLKKIDGTTPFTVAYVVQAALGGHAIPLDAGTLEVMRIVDLATDEEVAAGTITGLERAIPKRSGVEFGSLLHQLGTDFTENPFAPNIREKLLEIEPDAKSRLPKRETKKKPRTAEPTKPSEPPKKTAGSPAKGTAKATEGKTTAKKTPVTKKTSKKKTSQAKKETSAKAKSRSTTRGTKKATSGISKRKPR